MPKARAARTHLFFPFAAKAEAKSVFWKSQRRPHVLNWRDEYKLSKQPFRYGVGVSATASPILAQTGQAANPLSAFHLRRDLLHPARLSAPGVTSLNRRLSKDYERKVQTSEPLIQVAMIRLLLARVGCPPRQCRVTSRAGSQNW
jgi:hypothetical protein